MPGRGLDLCGFGVKITDFARYADTPVTSGSVSTVSARL
jgi:hypothetical protein